MLILFGTRGFKSSYRENIHKTCQICNHQEFSITTVSKWFTLFFIPIFPIAAKKYYFICQKCHNGYEIKSDIAKQFKDTE